MNIVHCAARHKLVCVEIGEAYDIITFGKSTKKSTDSQLIGMYGNGLKS